MDSKEPITARYAMISAISGFFTGILAGLVGLGGAELRIPFILYALKVPLYDMIVGNLIISIGISGVNFALRAQVGLLPPHALILSAAMIPGSLLGAFLGASITHRVSERRLKTFIAILLSLVVARLGVDFFAGISSSQTVLPIYFEALLSTAFGLLIGIVAGSIGVAGGEYRIPVLIFVFALPIKIAGTVSQLVSIPTIVIALLKHRSLGFFSRRSMTLAALMGIPSILGVIVSLRLLLASGEEFIRLIFALILLYTIIRLIVELNVRTAKDLP